MVAQGLVHREELLGRGGRAGAARTVTAMADESDFAATDAKARHHRRLRLDHGRGDEVAGSLDRRRWRGHALGSNDGITLVAGEAAAKQAYRPPLARPRHSVSSGVCPTPVAHYGGHPLTLRPEVAAVFCDSGGVDQG